MEKNGKTIKNKPAYLKKMLENGGFDDDNFYKDLNLKPAREAEQFKRPYIPPDSECTAIGGKYRLTRRCITLYRGLQGILRPITYFTLKL